WFYFVFMELRTMTTENIERARGLEVVYVRTLAALLDDNDLLAADSGVITQNWFLKPWKYRSLSIDTYTDHVLGVARLFHEHGRGLGHQSLFGSDYWSDQEPVEA